MSGFILVLGGTSTSGKSTISKHLKDKGFVVISLDDIFNEIRPDLNLNLYQDELSKSVPDRKEMVKRIKTYYFEGRNIVVDEVYPTLITKEFKPKDYNIKTILIYAGIDRLVINYHKRKFTDYRSIKSILIQFASLYEASNDSEDSLDTIGKMDFVKACHEDHKSFKNHNELKEFTKALINKLKISSSNKYIHPKHSYDLLIKNCDTSEKVADLILNHFFVKK